MSVQFGRWNFEGQPPASDYIEKVNTTLAPYGPDSNESYSKGGIRILYRAFHTTKESRREKQPHISSSEAVITWDGRLDNRADLIGDLRDSLTVNSTDVAIVAAAYEKWGANCLGKLIGDWALSIWNPRDRSVLFAKDPIGTKHLYYSFDDRQLTWSTILDPLVLFAGKTFEICEEYIAGWLAIPVFPAAHLTGYVGIHSVPPSSSVLLRPGRNVVSKYWDFDPGKRIHYRTDAEYEEHFRAVLDTAVQRRLRSDRPVLAELSGGMDSSSIVCMADLVIAKGQAQCPRLDTISWFEDSYDHLEPDTNELHWITRVEKGRNSVGFHINIGAVRQEEAKEVGSRKSFEFEFDNDRFAATPIPNNGRSEHFKQYAAYMKSQGHLVTLSGIGGDEPTGGGVPTPTPELQNLLARARFVTLTRQLNAWAAKMRSPRLPLLWEAVQGFFYARVDFPKEIAPVPWLHPNFVRWNRAAFSGYPFRVKLLGPLPSFQDHIHKLDANRRFVAYCGLRSDLLREIRYPYYDRDFLEFAYAIPREQIVRVGQRRSLMKRALVGIVPDELLKRRRKPFVPPKPKEDSSTEWPSLMEIGQHIIGSSVGIIAPDRFAEALQKAQHNGDVPVGRLKRVVTLESWLRHLTIQGVLTDSTPLEKKTNSPTLGAKQLQASTPPNSLASYGRELQERR
jgi:asparagine synthase (glutamine-hydrolysing)